MITRKALSNIVKEFYKEGRKVEDLVMTLTESTFGGKCSKSTNDEDMFDHIDFWWDTPKGQKIGVDVKGVKKLSRKDDKPTDKIHWIEYKNVNGNDGWIYTKAKYIAFKKFKTILFVDSNKLREYAEKVSKDTKVEYLPQDERQLYVLYQRPTRKDVIMIVPTSDLEEIASFAIEC